MKSASESMLGLPYSLNQYVASALALALCLQSQTMMMTMNSARCLHISVALVKILAVAVLLVCSPLSVFYQFLLCCWYLDFRVPDCMCTTFGM